MSSALVRASAERNIWQLRSWWNRERASSSNCITSRGCSYSGSYREATITTATSWGDFGEGFKQEFAAIEGFKEDPVEDSEVEVIDEDEALEEGTEES